MSNVLKITLDQGDAIVDQSGKANHVKRNANQQTITWKLAGNAHKGSIISFAWNAPPPPLPPANTFGPATHSPKKKHLHMTDLNNRSATKGEWPYTLKVKVGGKTYTAMANTTTTTTTLGPATAAVTNPTIKNN